MVLLSMINKETYRTGEIAKLLGVSTRTIQNYCIQGIIKDVIGEKGRRIITRSSIIEYLEHKGLLIDDSNSGRVDAIYARVSTHKQKISGDLERQIEELKCYASTNNPKQLKVYSDVDSGLNEKRQQLNKLLTDIMDNKIDRIFIAYKDRLTRFGFNYLETICAKHNTKIIISHEEDNKSEEELAEDIISIIHSFSDKLYGMRKKVHDEIEKELK